MEATIRKFKLGGARWKGGTEVVEGLFYQWVLKVIILLVPVSKYGTLYSPRKTML